MGCTRPNLCVAHIQPLITAGNDAVQLDGSLIVAALVSAERDICFAKGQADSVCFLFFLFFSE